MSNVCLDTSDELGIENIGMNFRPVVLQKTNFLKEGDYLYPEYQKNLTRQQRIIVTIINSVLTQKRTSFALSRKSLSDLLQQDRNWTQPIGLDKNKYRETIAHMCERHFDLVQEGEGNAPAVYRVKDPVLLRRLNRTADDMASDQREAVEFANNKKGASDHKADCSADHNPGTVCSIKNEELSIQDKEFSSENIVDSNLVGIQNTEIKNKVFARRTQQQESPASEPTLKVGSEGNQHSLEGLKELADKYGLVDSATKNYFDILLAQSRNPKLADFENALWPSYQKYEPNGLNWYRNRFAEKTGRAA